MKDKNIIIPNEGEIKYSESIPAIKKGENKYLYWKLFNITYFLENTNLVGPRDNPTKLFYGGTINEIRDDDDQALEIYMDLLAQIKNIDRINEKNIILKYNDPF